MPILVLFLYLLTPLLPYSHMPQAVAGPNPSEVVNGDVEVHQHKENTTEIHASDDSIIKYDTFDVASDHTVRFKQPSSSARVLNKVTGGEISNINGTLSANGQVYLANPSGVVVGEGGRVNTAKFVAAAASMSNQDFLNHTDRFTNTQGTVENHGTIVAKGVHLIGKKVRNFGEIRSANGMITMAAGDSVMLKEGPGDDVYPMIQNADLEGGTAVDGTAVKNEGTIHSGGGAVRMGAGDRFALALHNSGEIRAKDVRLRAKGDTQTKVSGTLRVRSQESGGRSNVSGVKGGDIEVYSKEIVINDLEADATGKDGGGSIRVGGDRHGTGEFETADHVYIDEDSTLDVSATNDGDAGEVIVWSDVSTYSYGNVSARGGMEGGDGGFVEISGKHLDTSIMYVDVKAPEGSDGTVLFDPQDIIINAGTADGTDDDGGDSGLLEEGGDQTVGFSEDSGDFNVYESELEGTSSDMTLQATKSITIDGTNNDFTDDGGVSDSGDILLQTDVSLTLETKNDANSGKIDLVTNAAEGDSLVVEAQGTGTFTINGSTSGTNAANITTPGELITANENITITTNNGDINLHELDAGTANITLDAAGTISQDTVDPINSSGLEVIAGPNADLNSSANYVGTLAADINGTSDSFLEFLDANDLTIGTVGSTTGITVADGYASIEAGRVSGGNVTIDDTVDLNDADTGDAHRAALFIDSNAGSISQNSNDDITAQQVELVGNGPVTLTNSGNNVDWISADITGSGNALKFTDSTERLVVNTGFILGTAGITTNDGNLELTANGSAGDTWLNEDVSLGTGTMIWKRPNGGKVRQTSGNTITASALKLLSQGPVDLPESNDVGTIAADISGSSNNFTYTDANALTVGAVDGTSNVATTDGNVVLTTGGDLDMSRDITAGTGDVKLDLGGGVIEGSDYIRGGGLEVVAVTSVELTGDNNVDTLAVDITGTGDQDFTYSDNDALTVGTVGGTTGIQTADGGASLTAGGTITVDDNITLTDADTSDSDLAALKLEAGGSVTQNTDDVITAQQVELLGPGPVTLTDPDNDVDWISGDLSGNGNALKFTDKDDLRINAGNFLGTSGISTTDGDVVLTTGGDLDMSRDITAGTGDVKLDLGGGVIEGSDYIRGGGLEVVAVTAVELTGDNNMDTLAADITGSGNRLSYTDTDALTVGAVGGTSGVSTNSADITLDAGGTIDQTSGDTIVGAGLELLGTGPITLNQSNDVNTIAANISGSGNSISYTNNNVVTVGSVGGTTGITSQNGAVNLTVEGDDNMLTVSENVNTNDTGSGSVSLTADEMDIQDPDNDTSTATIKAGSSRITLKTDTADTVDDVALGASETSNNDVLELSNAELENNISFGTLEVKASGDGNKITMSSDVTTGSEGNLTLTADEMDLSNTLDIGSNTLRLQPETTADAGDDIQLGSTSDSQSNTLELSESEVYHHNNGTENQIYGTLILGNSSMTGNVITQNDSDNEVIVSNDTTADDISMEMITDGSIKFHDRLFNRENTMVLRAGGDIVQDDGVDSDGNDHANMQGVDLQIEDLSPGTANSITLDDHFNAFYSVKVINNSNEWEGSSGGPDDVSITTNFVDMTLKNIDVTSGGDLKVKHLWDFQDVADGKIIVGNAVSGEVVEIKSDKLDVNASVTGNTEVAVAPVLTNIKTKADGSDTGTDSDEDSFTDVDDIEFVSSKSGNADLYELTDGDVDNLSAPKVKIGKDTAGDVTGGTVTLNARVTPAGIDDSNDELVISAWDDSNVTVDMEITNATGDSTSDLDLSSPTNAGDLTLEVLDRTESASGELQINSNAKVTVPGTITKKAGTKDINGTVDPELVWINPGEGRGVDLGETGEDPGDGKVDLSDAEIDRITTDRLWIGNEEGDEIVITDDISVPSDQIGSLRLLSDARIVQEKGTSMAAADLTMEAGTDMTLNGVLPSGPGRVMELVAGGEIDMPGHPEQRRLELQSFSATAGGGMYLGRSIFASGPIVLDGALTKPSDVILAPSGRGDIRRVVAEDDEVSRPGEQTNPLEVNSVAGGESEVVDNWTPGTEAEKQELWRMLRDKIVRDEE